MVKAITYILVNDATVASLVGDNREADTAKVYPVIATQTEKYPFVVVRQSSRVPEYCRGQRPSTFNYTYDVIIVAKDYDELEALQTAVIDAIENQAISSTINGVRFTDRIRNTNSEDGEYIEQYECHQRILSFAGVVHESQVT
jgi:hypothetical protein